jgi:NAD(P)-dependent dehydrogenase (short-subunit alcohol dehydrogenase family)
MTPVAVVTGAARGIGAAIGDRLQSDGWQVIGIDRDPIARFGALQLDLADAAAVSAQLARLPRVDALVNNAALQLHKPLLDTSTEEWDALFAVNLRAPFVCLRGVARQLIAARGAVVNVSSVHATATSLSMGAYAASKGAISALTRAAALELAPHGVRVNTVAPGAVETPSLRDGLDRRPDVERSLVQRTPLSRIGQPDEIAQAVAFLLDGERSGFITGQCIVVDGGALARLGTE